MAQKEACDKIVQTLGWEVILADALPQADWETVMRSYAEKDYDLIIAPGGQFVQTTLKVAPDYPNVKFVMQGGPEDQSYPANVLNLLLRMEESSYLAGIVGASMTMTNKIGLIGSKALPTIINIVENFKLAAATYNPNVTFITSYIGSSDVAKQYEATISLAGLAGMSEVSGYHHTLMDTLSPGYGFTAVVINVLGVGHPLGVLLGSLLFAFLFVGFDQMRFAVGLPIDIVYIVQGLVMFFVMSSHVLVRRWERKR